MIETTRENAFYLNTDRDQSTERDTGINYKSPPRNYFNKLMSSEERKLNGSGRISYMDSAKRVNIQ